MTGTRVQMRVRLVQLEVSLRSGILKGIVIPKILRKRTSCTLRGEDYSIAPTCMLFLVLNIEPWEIQSLRKKQALLWNPTTDHLSNLWKTFLIHLPANGERSRLINGDPLSLLMHVPLVPVFPTFTAPLSRVRQLASFISHCELILTSDPHSPLLTTNRTTPY